MILIPVILENFLEIYGPLLFWKLNEILNIYRQASCRQMGIWQQNKIKQ